MATERLVIQIEQRGARRVRADLSGLGTKARQASIQVGALNRALNIFTGFLVARFVTRAADSFTNLTNRVRLVTRSQREFNEVLERTIEVSDQTRTSLDSNALLVARLGKSLKGLGITTLGTLDIIETINQAVIVSGVTSREASNALVQLAQAFDENRLRGQELRSVMQQLPRVADILTKSLGTTRGGLRKLSEQGKITGEVMARAFREAREEIAEEFALTIPTIDQSFVRFRNRLVVFVGALDKTISVFRLLSRAIVRAGENIETIARIIGVVLVARLTSAVRGIVLFNAALLITNIRARGFVSTLKFLNVALGTGLLKFLPIAIGALAIFSDKIKLSSKDSTTLADVGKEAFLEIGESARDVGILVGEVFAEIVTISREELARAGIPFGELATIAALTFDAILAFARGTFTGIVIIFTDLPKRLESIFNKVGERIGRELGVAFSKPARDLRAQIARIRQELVRLQGLRFRGLATDLEKISEIRFRIEKRELEKQLNVILGLAAPVGNQMGRDLALELTIGFTKAFEITTIARDLLAKARSVRTQLEREAARPEAAVEPGLSPEARVLLSKLNKGTEKRIANQKALNELFLAGEINVARFSRESAKLAQIFSNQESALGALSDKFRAVDTSAIKLGEDIGNLLVGAINSASNALADFATSGFQDVESLRAAFSSFFKQLAKDLIAATIKLLIFSAIKAALGGGLPTPGAGGGGQTVGQSGSVLAGISPGFAALPRQAGGPVRQGSPVLVGERGPELFVPTAGGRVVPNVSMTNEVPVTIVNVRDPDEIPTAMASARGERVILNVIQQNADQLRRVIG